MNIVRAFIIGVIIWIIGVSFYSASYFVPILENLEFQANLVLALAIIPSAWIGSKFYYRKGANLNGFTVGAIVLLVAISLDAIITVPYLIMPYGGSYQSFFSAPSFWLIALEYFLLVVSYWHFNIKPARR